MLPRGFDNYNTKNITCRFHNEEDLHTDPNEKYCGRVKFHHHKIGGYFFDKNIFNKEYDIVQTHEYFGSGESPHRLQIISKRLKEIIEKNKLNGLSFIPVMHERFIR